MLILGICWIKAGRWMDGWMDGWTSGYTAGWMHKQIVGHITSFWEGKLMFEYLSYVGEKDSCLAGGWGRQGLFPRWWSSEFRSRSMLKVSMYLLAYWLICAVYISAIASWSQIYWYDQEQGNTFNDQLYACQYSDSTHFQSTTKLNCPCQLTDS